MTWTFQFIKYFAKVWGRNLEVEFQQIKKTKSPEKIIPSDFLLV